MTKILSAALAICCALPLAAQDSALAPHQQLARDVYRQLVEINTADSAGSVTLAAEAVAERFRAAGFPAEDVMLLVPDGKPTKGNLVVRYRGRGEGKPILLLAHLDVVAALRADWSLDPFVLTEKDGYFYGRGTADDKAMAAIFVANLLRARAAGWQPAHDVVLALTADEEGGPANGVEWLLAQHRELIDASFAINEGGTGALRDGRPFYQAVQAAEKVPITFTLTVTNRGGHSSLPRPDNAIFQLAEGLVRVRRHVFPVRLNPVTRAFFEATAGLEEPKTAAAMRALLRNPRDTAAARLLSVSPRYNAVLRTTCTATRLAGGHANNALPQLATATVNCRVLPGESLDSVKATLARVVADTGIRIGEAVPRHEPPSIPSPLGAEIMEPVAAVTRELFGPRVPSVPFMSTGATDGRFLRAAGVPTYGVSGLYGDPNDVRAHGRDERMLVKSFFDGQEFLYRLMVRLAGGAAGAGTP
ncbi:MAG TPA: M20/M25/M40 family metallo-hydrolase [Gemmatimonadales bacterium]|nr:M20/M25/M40 family metallo-hydrolase [Gemmatimonadales bacterium]